MPVIDGIDQQNSADLDHDIVKCAIWSFERHLKSGFASGMANPDEKRIIYKQVDKTMESLAELLETLEMYMKQYKLKVSGQPRGVYPHIKDQNSRLRMKVETDKPFYG